MTNKTNNTVTENDAASILTAEEKKKAILEGSTYGDAALIVSAQHQTTGTFAEEFRLKSDYLPCLLGTKAGDKYENGTGYALINIENQTVEDIVFTSESTGSDPIPFGYVLEDKSTDKAIAISCLMANGGVNFT